MLTRPGWVRRTPSPSWTLVMGMARSIQLCRGAGTPCQGKEFDRSGWSVVVTASYDAVGPSRRRAPDEAPPVRSRRVLVPCVLRHCSREIAIRVTGSRQARLTRLQRLSGRDRHARWSDFGNTRVLFMCEARQHVAAIAGRDGRSVLRPKLCRRPPFILLIRDPLAEAMLDAMLRIRG
jgi:hypothetical protein